MSNTDPVSDQLEQGCLADSSASPLNTNKFYTHEQPIVSKRLTKTEILSLDQTDIRVVMNFGQVPVLIAANYTN